MQSTFPADGLVVFAKRDCPTCAMLEPLLAEIDRGGIPLIACIQDDPTFPKGVRRVLDDTSLEHAYRHCIEIVPTVIRFAGGKEVDRVIGWHREDWRRVTESPRLGEALPAMRPGCGSLSTLPGVAEELTARFGDSGLKARALELDQWDDPHEACFDRGWSDGLPVVPPTDARILRMLSGTRRSPSEVIGQVPPNLTDCTVEKIAINAVMAGCRPEYMPVVIAALEAALEPKFTLHGLLCSTCFSGPIVVVNGAVTRAIGMNSGINALGPGNRANATIGRALNLVLRNVGGALPGRIDRSTLGAPAKYTCCFAEDESDATWEPLSARRGIDAPAGAVTLFQGDGILGFIDQRSRTAPELTRSLAMSLFGVGHPKLCEFTNAMLVLAPEHYAIYRNAGWTRRDIESALFEHLKRPGRDLIQGALGVGEGIAPDRANDVVSKFWPEGLLIVRAGGPAGLFSAILPGWTGGRFREDSQPITRGITSS